MPVGSWIPMMNIANGGEQVGNSGLRTRIFASAAGVRVVEVEGSQVLHVLGGAVGRGELDQPGPVPETVPRLAVRLDGGKGERRMKQRRRIVLAFVVRRGHQDTKGAVGTGAEGEGHGHWISNCYSDVTSLDGDPRQGSEGAARGARIFIVDPRFRQPADRAGLGCVWLARIPQS